MAIGSGTRKSSALDRVRVRSLVFSTFDDADIDQYWIFTVYGVELSERSLSADANVTQHLERICRCSFSHAVNLLAFFSLFVSLALCLRAHQSDSRSSSLPFLGGTTRPSLAFSFTGAFTRFLRGRLLERKKKKKKASTPQDRKMKEDAIIAILILSPKSGFTFGHHYHQYLLQYHPYHVSSLLFFALSLLLFHC